MNNLSSPHGAIAQWDKKGSEKSFLFLSNPLKNHSLDSIFSFSFNNASFTACDKVENRFILILSSIQSKSPGSIDTDLLTDKGSFFFGRTINSDNVPKLINNFITITFMVVPYTTKMVKRRDRYEREQNN